MMPKPHFSNCQNIFCNELLSEYEYKKQLGGKGCHYHRFCKLCRKKCKYGGDSIVWNCFQCKTRMTIGKYTISKIYCQNCRDERKTDYGKWYYKHRRYKPHPILRHLTRRGILKIISDKQSDISSRELEIRVDRKYSDIYHHLRILLTHGYLEKTKWKTYKMTPLAKAEMVTYEQAIHK